MSQFVRRFQLPIVVALFLTGSAFLLKMCYLSLAFNTLFGITYLTAFLRVRTSALQRRCPAAAVGVRPRRFGSRRSGKLLPHVWPRVRAAALR
jgi:hypothetical protein